MHSDSAYIAISASCLKDVIVPSMKDDYKRWLKGFCTDSDVIADSQYYWFPQTLCAKNTKYGKKPLGLGK